MPKSGAASSWLPPASFKAWVRRLVAKSRMERIIFLLPYYTWMLLLALGTLRLLGRESSGERPASDQAFL
jgi:hypothetical protein